MANAELATFRVVQANTGGTVVLDGQDALVIIESGLLASLTVRIPSPLETETLNGRHYHLRFTGTITVLFFQLPDTAPGVGIPITVVGGTAVTLVYDGPGNKWYRWL